MNGVNTVLMIILSTMIGFAIGNVWGKEVMKRTLAELIDQITNGLQSAAGKKEKGE